MTATQSLKIYELLNAQFSQPEKARQLTEAIEAVIDEKVLEGNKKYEALLNKDLQIFRSDMDVRFKGVETKIIESQSLLKAEMKEQKVDMVKWFVSLFFALALMILGLYFRK